MEKKIIHVALGKANPLRMNGVNKVVNELAEHQVKQGRDVEFWGITHNPVHDYPKRSYTTHLFQDNAFKFKLDPAIRLKLLGLNTNDVIFHLHGGFLPQLYSFSRQLRRYGFSYVFTPHGAFNEIAMQRSSIRKGVYVALFEKNLVNHARYIHSIGASEQVGTRKRFGEVDQRLIPNGQEKTAHSSDSTERGSIPNFGFVGRLDLKTKGLDLLMAGLAKTLENTDIKPHLHLIGDGPDRSKLEQMARLWKIDQHISFHGALYGREKEEQMKKMDVLCLTSRNEGLPGVVLEAAALGVPCIISPETNLGPFVTKHQAGWVLQKNSPVQICLAMQEALMVLQRDEWREYSHRAKTMVEESFDWNRIAAQHLKAYES